MKLTILSWTCLRHCDRDSSLTRTLSGWLNHVSVDYISVKKVQNIENCSMNMWQSRVVINQLNLAYFDLRYHVRSAVAQNFR